MNGIELFKKTEIIKAISAREAKAPNLTAPEVDRNDISKLIKQWEAEEEYCRGGSDENPKIRKACDRRNNVTQKLQKKQAGVGGEMIRP